MLAAIVFATLSALCSACGAVLQRLALTGRTSTTARSLWRTATDLVRQPRNSPGFPGARAPPRT